jgi:multicomponent Na+:H+ antiporter subunit A
VVLGLATTLNGLFPNRIATPIVQAAVTAARGEHTEVKLTLWHGFSPVMLLSLATLAVGAMFYLLRRPLLRAAGVLGVLGRLGPTRAYQLALDGGLSAAGKLTGRLQSGSLRGYLTIPIGTRVVLAGWTLKTRWGPPTFPPVEDLEFHILAAALLVLAGTVGVLAAGTRLLAIVSLGLVGYGMALVFLFHGGPDLAMTQLAVETLAVVLFVYVLRDLPRQRRVGGWTARVRDATLALAGGAVMTWIALAAIRVEHPVDLRRWLSGASVPLAYGRNVVNVILVDFRALDTLGEITVLAAAALGVWALLRLQPTDREDA